ncbi:hypothetical protein CYMTET_27826 [Cymbomonas tetramitiformis]|uniref:Uncharacterized protein n=1 Tax=Cymbomonas tetramitiformis TaxID=36881 RepID=A0AAE0FPJ4_9CHLO|nr:hypothetical protein CYMTET_27826 [Cymbomonas tetramitiformis]
MAGKLANGGDGERQGARHGKLPVALAATNMAAPHIVLSCKRFFLVEDPLVGGAVRGVRVDSAEFKLSDPLQVTFYRRNIIGRVAPSDAYPPNLAVVRRDGFIWERRGTGFWSAGMLIKSPMILEALGLIPSAMVRGEHRRGATLKIDRSGRLTLKYDASRRHPNARDHLEQWRHTFKVDTVVRVFLGSHHKDYRWVRSRRLTGSVPPSGTDNWWLYAADMRVVFVGTRYINLEEVLW